MHNDDILYSWFPMLVTPDIVDLCGDVQAEKRVDPLLDGQAVTFAKMRHAHSDQHLSEAQLLKHWGSMRCTGKGNRRSVAIQSTSTSMVTNASLHSCIGWKCAPGHQATKRTFI